MMDDERKIEKKRLQALRNVKRLFSQEDDLRGKLESVEHDLKLRIARKILRQAESYS